MTYASHIFSFLVFRPVNFLRSFSYSNRFTTAATFGATANSCLRLFLNFTPGASSSSSFPVWSNGEKMVLFIQNTFYLKHAYPDLSKVPVFIINICLFLSIFLIQKDVHSHRYSLDSCCHQ